MADEKESSKQVSVTWKWLAIIMCTVVGFFAVSDRESFQSRLTNAEAEIKQMHDVIVGLPYQLRDLQQSVDEISRKQKEPGK